MIHRDLTDNAATTARSEEQFHGGEKTCHSRERDELDEAVSCEHSTQCHTPNDTATQGNLKDTGEKEKMPVSTLGDTKRVRVASKVANEWHR